MGGHNMGRKTIRRGTHAAAAFLFLASNLLATLVMGGGAVRANASQGGTAKVWLTLPDQSKLVSPEPDVTWAENSAPQANELSVRVDPTKTFQSMQGVGASMTESSAYLFSTKLTAQQRSLVFPALFSKQYGAGIDVVRVPWGVTDFSLGEYTYNDNPPGGTDAPQDNFSIDHDLQYIMPRLQEAKTANPNLKMMMAPWTAPAWMKTSLVPGRPLAFGPLKPEFLDSYGTYLTKAVNGYADNNLAPGAFSITNEPLTPTTNPSNFFSAADQANMIKNYVGPKIAANAVKPQILAHDEDWQDERDTVAPGSVLSVLSDAAAANYIDGVAYHCYHGESTRQLLLQKNFPSKDIYVTECTGSITPPAQWDDDFGWGMRNMIIKPIRNYAAASIYWNLALDENSGPKTRTDSGCQACRGVVTVTNAGAVSAGPEYYILAHYGKFVQPGAARIDSTTYGEGSVETVAFKNPDGGKALVAFNSATSAKAVAVREGNATFRYTIPAGAAASFTWGGPDNNTRDLDTGRIEAENYSSTSPANLPKLNITDAGKADQSIQLANDEQLRFNNVNFQGVASSFQMRYQTLFSGNVEIRQDGAAGPLLATIPFGPTPWASTPVTVGGTIPASGAHTLYVIAKSTTGGKVIDINWLKFAENAPNPNPVAKSAWKAYGVFSPGSNVPANVLDNNNSTRWTTGVPMSYGHYLTLDLGKQTTLTSVGAYSQPGDRPSKVKVEVSDNGLDYTTVQTGYTPPADLYQIPLSAPSMGRYVRLTELNENMSVGSWWSMNEVNGYFH